MKLLFDFLPIVIFFIAYKFFGIYVATAAAISTSFLQVIGYWIKHKHVPPLQWISLAILIVLGGGTLLLHDEWLIKWKPTVLNWIFAMIFLATQFFSEKPLIQRVMEKNISLPKAVWTTLNLSWIVFFTVMGIANIFVAYHYSTDTWVNFKLFGLLGLTIAFAIVQAAYLSRYVKPDTE